MQLKSSIAADAYDDIQTELTGLTFNRLFPTVLIGCCGMVSATALMAYAYRDSALWGIAGLALLVCLARCGVVLGHARQPIDMTPTAQDAARWDSLFGITTIAFGSVFALVTLRVFSLRDVPGELLCTIGCFAPCCDLAGRPGSRPRFQKIGGMIPLAALTFAALVFGPPLVKAAGFVAALSGVTFFEAADRNFDRVVEQFRASRALAINSQLDPLTSLPNRKFMRTRLNALCKGDTPFAVLFLDLDDFKVVNDTMGHSAGDDLLLQVTARLKTMMRETDLLARVGGDEFAVLQTPAKSKREVVALAERINQQIAAPYRIHGEKTVIGVSIGVRLALGGINEPDDVLHRADTALYNVKAGGKGGYSVALE